MKYIPTRLLYSLLLISLLLFFLLPKTYAHMSGQPYIKVNGEYANANPLVEISSSLNPTTVFQTGQDEASSSGYLVNDKIVFEIDEQFAPFAYTGGANGFGSNQGPINSIVYRWNFGDGSTPKEGKKVTYEYTHTGTFFIDLSIKIPDKQGDFTSVDTIQIHIKPTKGYQFPQVKIKTNGKIVDDPLFDSVEINPNRTVNFEAVDSVGNIRSYQWDFGDNSGGNGQKVRHKYNAKDFYGGYSVLRIADENNIMVDVFINLSIPLKKPNFFIGIFDAIKDFFSNLFHR
ncbi:PKD domain-containing protein [Candidatus Gottesmanbacteria bacterium]|nr:PKD domain-containing protein [Candidatus Gottesmanbacteria bacterium]